MKEISFFIPITYITRPVSLLSSFVYYQITLEKPKLLLVLLHRRRFFSYFRFAFFTSNSVLRAQPKCYLYELFTYKNLQNFHTKIIVNWMQYLFDKFPNFRASRTRTLRITKLKTTNTQEEFNGLIETYREREAATKSKLIFNSSPNTRSN